jgi:hypothetical protein
MHKKQIGFPVALCILITLACSACNDNTNTSPASTTQFEAFEFNFVGNGILNPDEGYILKVAGVDYAVRPHTRETLTQYAARTGQTEIRPTHYVEDVTVPRDETIRIQMRDHDDNLKMVLIYVAPGYRAAEDRKQPSYFTAATSQANSTDYVDDLNELETLKSNTFEVDKEIVKAIVFHHPQLMTKQPDKAAHILKLIPETSDYLHAVLAVHDAVQWNKKASLDTTLTLPSGKTMSLYQYNYDVGHVKTNAQGCLGEVLSMMQNEPANAGVYYYVPQNTPPAPQSIFATDIRRTETSSGGYTYTSSYSGTSHGARIKLTSADNTAVTFKVSNYKLRFLSCYVEFYDVNNNIIQVTEKFADINAAGAQDDETKFVGFILSRGAMYGIPLDPVEDSFTISFPSNAAKAKIMLGGLGMGGYRKLMVEALGLGATAAFNIGVPTMLLAAFVGSNISTQIVDGLAVGSGMIDGLVEWILDSQYGNKNTSDILKDMAVDFAKFLATKNAVKLLSFIVNEITEEEFEDEVPFIGWAFLAADMAGTAAELGETIAAVTESPFIIENTITRTHNISLTMLPDKNDYEFPATATSYEGIMVFDNADPIPFNGPVSSGSEQITHEFSNVPAGGTVSVYVEFSSNTGWVDGSKKVTGISNLNGSGEDSLAISFHIDEKKVPLTAATTYSHKNILAYNGSDYTFSEGSAPTETISNLSQSGSTPSLGGLTDITFTDPSGNVGYAWESYSPGIGGCDGGSGDGQVYLFQNISLKNMASNDGNQYLSCGYTARTPISYQVVSPVDNINYVIVPDTTGTLYNVHQVTLGGTTGDFNISGSNFCGVFQQPQDQIIIGNSGTDLYGLNKDFSTLSVLTAVTTNPPKATIKGGPATSMASAAANPHLFINPKAIGTSLNGTILVLDQVWDAPDSNGKQGVIRAFNKFGEPTRYFPDSSYTALLKTDGSNPEYLDMAVESTGYIYVLSYLNDGAAVTDYNLDIYKPDGTFLSRTSGLSAGRLTVSYWRNLYSLNFASITGESGKTEPSFSQWIPSTPSD